MEKQIILSDEKKKELAASFGYSRQTVWAALKFKTKSAVANMLRKAALERGGIMIGENTDKVTPDFETRFLTADQLMIQKFTPRVQVVADLATGDVKVNVDGEAVEVYENAKLSQFPAIQETAQHIANQLK
ncbi:hypothetical protein [uncultured Culturomica sp.]|jgi:hypothetical protein|uniref:hypothetical protein n=1 Tax=uncultured Culturomica sp. TaxID=1926654 RepID=UPI00033FA437|nr:hypothetical protein [uncultured Culturomica sp.]CCZ10487.1 uncharacterized protein BN783_01611 [Odoribacter sp. CAG:788]